MHAIEGAIVGVAAELEVVVGISDLIRHDGGIMEKLALLFYYSKKAQSLPCIEEVYVKTMNMDIL